MRKQPLLAAGIALGWLVGCSVYDASLLSHRASLAESGGGSMGDLGGAQDHVDAGAGATSLPDAGGTDTGGTDTGGGAGSDNALSGGAGLAEAGDSTGGTGGAGGSVAGGAGSNAGSSGSAGTGGVPPTQLAVGKSATASSQEVGHETKYGDDNDGTTRWCASDGTFPQWWRVDLGASHQLSQVSLSFEHPERSYYYTVETSANDTVYALQLTATGTGIVQTLDLPPGVSARYVRVTITKALPPSVNGNGTWASFFECSLTGY